MFSFGSIKLSRWNMNTYMPFWMSIMKLELILRLETVVILSLFVLEY